MRVEIVNAVVNQLRQRRSELLRDRSLPLHVRRMIQLHMAKPWIPNFGTIAIRPTHAGSESYLDFPIVYAVGSNWFFPSRQWWVAHAKSSHPPDGSGCDVDVHTKFLSSEGSIHEFDYVNILTDGRTKILGRRDFTDECVWWARQGHLFS